MKYGYGNADILCLLIAAMIFPGVGVSIAQSHQTSIGVD